MRGWLSVVWYRPNVDDSDSQAHRRDVELGRVVTLKTSSELQPWPSHGIRILAEPAASVK